MFYLNKGSSRLSWKRVRLRDSFTYRHTGGKIMQERTYNPTEQSGQVIKLFYITPWDGNMLKILIYDRLFVYYKTTVKRAVWTK